MFVIRSIILLPYFLLFMKDIRNILKKDFALQLDNIIAICHFKREPIKYSKELFIFL